MRRIIIHTLIILFILLLGISPFLVTAIAGTIADTNGCTLHEGFVNPCIINGKDWGQDLYMMGMIGWFTIATLPVAVGVAAIYLLVVVILALVQWSRRRRITATASTTN